jgi:hypothetical protein
LDFRNTVDIERRQVDPCLASGGACSWLSGITGCPSNDNACICKVFDSVTTSQVSSCVSCEQPINGTFAADISAQGLNCSSSGSRSSTSTTSTTTTSDAAAACYTASCEWLAGILSCQQNSTDFTDCICRIVNPATPNEVSGCYSCLEVANQTLASDLVYLEGYCAATPSATTGSTTTAPPITPSVTTLSIQPTTTSITSKSDAWSLSDTAISRSFPVMLALIVWVVCRLW